MIIAGYNLRKYFIAGGMFTRNPPVIKAVQDVDIKIPEGKIVGLVGESGSGKTTLGKLLIGLEKVTAGSILFDIPNERLKEYEEAKETGDLNKLNKIREEFDIANLSLDKLRHIRKYMGIVFQDPYASLNPRMRIIDIIKEPMISTRYLEGEKANQRVMELLEKVGLPKSFAYRYPHELSGGQRQRVAIARAIATDPKFVVLDEPTSALDVSTQAQILNMIKDLQKIMDTSFLLITHNIAVASYLSEEIYVMYAGKIVEKGTKDQIINDPKHPYTIALISAVPRIGYKMKRIILKGEPPNLIDLPKGCVFHPRCPLAFDICGWNSKEIAEDLKFLIEGKYFDFIKDKAEFQILDEYTLRLKGLSKENIEEIIKLEIDNIPSLKAVSEINSLDNNEIEIKLKKYKEPSMYILKDGRQVRCLLFQ